jgi:hypothetical protein
MLSSGTTSIRVGGPVRATARRRETRSPTRFTRRRARSGSRSSPDDPPGAGPRRLGADVAVGQRGARP